MDTTNMTARSAERGICPDCGQHMDSCTCLVPVCTDGKWQQFTGAQARKRKATLEGFRIEHERIVSSGKFEGCPIFAPYYWDVGLEGFADADNGSEYVFRFTNDGEDFALWPELKKWLGRKRTLRMRESDQGFIYCD